MSLATRCTACGTVFRVVQDQLKVSEGWVRCGQCSAVFNALEGLFDLARETPTDAGGAMPPVEDVPKAGGDTVMASAGLFGGKEPDEPGGTGDHVVSDAAPVADDDSLPEAVNSTSEDDAPGFVTEARRRARWDNPWWRATMSVLAALLFALLTLQGAHHFRDDIAARSPAMQTTLTAWCAAAGCTVRPPRRIQDVAVESTALARSATLPQAFVLAVVLRNRGALPTTPPSIDLSLTDMAGRLVSRRMLSASDFGASSAPLRPGSETTWQLLLSTGSEQVAGYTVELFYP